MKKQNKKGYFQVEYFYKMAETNFRQDRFIYLRIRPGGRKDF